MSWRPQGHAPNIMNRPNRSGSPILKDSLPTGTVGARLRRFYELSSQVDSTDDPNSTDRPRIETAVGSGRSQRSHFTKSSTQYLGIPDFRAPPATHSFVFHSCGRYKHDEQRGRTSGSRTPLLLQPSCRRSFSMGHLCNKFGLTEMHSSSGQHSSNTAKETTPSPAHLPLPTATYGTPSFANPLLPTKKQKALRLVSPISHNTPDQEKWRSARDMFTQYDISRPSGWLSDIEDLSLSGDGNASPRRYCRHCHICSTPTWAPTHCSSCGHRLCERCACEASSGTPQAHANFLHHPSPTITRDGSQYVSASRSNLESTQMFRQQVGIACSTSDGRHQDRINTQHNRSSTHRADSSWRNRNDKRGQETTLPKKSTPAIKDNSHMSEEQYKQMQSGSKRFSKKNPFLIRDRQSQGKEAEKDICSHAANGMECDDPMCRATHAGHYPFRHSVSCPKHQSQQRNPVLDASNKPPRAEGFEKHGPDANLPPGQANIVHRHHSAGFHSSHHIAEHLSSAVGHDAYDLLKGRNKKRIKPNPSKLNIRSGLYLEPLTKAKSVIELDSFQWAPDPIPTGHPNHSNNGRQQHSLTTKAATSTPDRWLPGIATEKTAREARQDVSGEATTHGEQREIHNVSNVSLCDNEPPRLRLASTPSWLKNPTKEAADATAPLHHIGTKNHKTHEHDHGYLSSVTVDDLNFLRIHGGSSQASDQVVIPAPLSTSHIRRHQDARSQLASHHGDHIRTQSSYEEKSQGERHVFSTAIRDSMPLMRPETHHMTPEIRIDPPQHKHRDTPASVSKRREIFEHAEDHADIATSANTASSRHSKSAIRKTHSQQGQQHKATSTSESGLSHREENATPTSSHASPRQQESGNALISTTHRSQQELGHTETKSFVEHLSEPEITKPTPIAPPNHECTWKERYLDLTAEIRHLKAELSTRASLKGSDILGSSYGQREDDLDLLEVTIILHFRDRDDIVINTDVVQDAEPGN
ncbi:hypothetical protein F5Y12DRAFT_713436 [Xylaria sp. FL1777]|nr:hypothetical protein F5Y12DRAFT_713436 [Xylaria sp. FL1777]